MGKTWKVITSERSAKEEFFQTKKGKIFAWFQRFSDKIVCNSENAKKMWIKHYPLYKEKLSVIYNSVYINKKINTKYIPKKNGKLNIVVLASYQYLKNPIGLINAVKTMSEDEKNKFNINWYGNPFKTMSDCYERSISKIKEYKLEDCINPETFQEWLEKNSELSKIIHLFLLGYFCFTASSVTLISVG